MKHPLSSTSPQRPVSSLLRRMLGTTLLPLLCATAQAQSTAPSQPTCRVDVDGRIASTPSPCARMARAPGTPRAAVATRPAGDARRAEVLRERDANGRVAPRSAEPQIDGATILRDRMGAV